MTLVCEKSLVSRAARFAWERRQQLTLEEWSDKYRRIPKGNPEPGPWRTSRVPYVRRLMLAMEDPTVKEITGMFGSQLAKTETMQNREFKGVKEAGERWLTVYPSDILGRKVLKKRMRPALMAMPAFDGVFLPDRLKSGANELNFANGGSIAVVGSGSSTNVRSTPYAFIAIDEFDLCAAENPNILQEARQRTGAFSKSLILKLGTAGLTGQGICAQYDLSTREHYYVPCPECSHYQQLRFPRVRWEGGLDADPDEVERSAWYECEKCECRIHNHAKGEMLARGVWIKEGESVVVEEDGTAHGSGDVAPSSHVGLQLNSLYSPFQTFGWVARDFVEAKGNPGQVWINGKLAEGWAVKGETLEVAALEPLCVRAAGGGYKMGTVPPDVLRLLMIVDVQADHCWAQVSGWTAGGTDCYLIWCEKIESPPGTGLWQLDQLRLTKFPCSGGTMPVVATFIDSGYRTAEVYEYCIGRKGKFVYPVKGEETMAEPYRATMIEKMPGGKPIPGSIYLLRVNNAHWTQAVWGMMQNSMRAIAGKADEAPPDLTRPAGRLYLPEDCPRWVLEQLTSEAAIPKKKAGQTIVTWQKRPGRNDNHLLDCARYNAAGADWIGMKRLMRPGADNSGTLSQISGNAGKSRIGGASGGILDARKARENP